jgi:hypothetical protein
MRGLLLVFISVACVLGCGPSESSVVGTYRGQLIQDPSDNSIGSNLQRGIASSMSLELKPDHTFTMVVAILPVSGNWSLAGSTLTCTPTASMGVASASSKPFELHVSGDKLEPIDKVGQQFSFQKQAN